MDLIEVENVYKVYQSGTHFRKSIVNALQGVTLSIKQGECLAVVGESGSGKSTLGRLVIGLERPTSGTIRFKGEALDPNNMDRSTRRALQMVYQNSFEAVDHNFTAKQAVEEPLRYFRLMPKSDRWGRISDLLEKVGIPAVEADKKTYEFSGGQLQRICIARALAAEPELLLLDEPLSSLDVSVQAQILNLLKELRAEFGLTYMLISHDLETVYNLADRVVVMYFGRIVEEIDDITLFQELKHPYTSLLLGKTDAVPNDSASEQSPRVAGCVYADRCPLCSEKCRNEIPELIEISPGHRIACHLAGTL